MGELILCLLSFVLHDEIIYVWPLVYRMLITGTPFVMPTRIEWIALLLLVGTLGFIGQASITYCPISMETNGQFTT